MHASQIQGCVVEQRVEKKRKIAESVCVRLQVSCVEWDVKPYCLYQSGDEGWMSLMQDDAVNITHNDGSAIFSEADEICDVNSTSNTADVVATSSPQETLTTGGSTAPEHITVDDAIAVSPDSDQEKTETPTSPKDVAGPSRSSMFSKRAGVTPSTPPIKESRSKKSHPAVEEHPKHKGCCTIV